MNKYSVVAALLGATQQAPSPLPDTATAFPKYQTQTAPSGGTALDANNVLIAWSYNAATGSNIAGPYRAYRSDLVVFPTQTLTAESANDQVVTTAISGTRTFFPTSTTMLGAYEPKIGTVANNAVWMVCLSGFIALATTCNGGVG